MVKEMLLDALNKHYSQFDISWHPNWNPYICKGLPTLQFGERDENPSDSSYAGQNNVYFTPAALKSPQTGQPIGQDCFVCSVVLTAHTDTKEVINTLFPPTFIIDSGNGYHYYWFIDEPIFEVAEFNMLSNAANLMLYRPVPTTGATTLLRVPGTKSVKSGKRHVKEPSKDTEMKDVVIVASQLDAIYKIETIKRVLTLAQLNPKVFKKILTGTKTGFSSEEARDDHILDKLVRAGFSTDEIKLIIENNPIGTNTFQNLEAEIKKVKNQIKSEINKRKKQKTNGIAVGKEGIFAIKGGRPSPVSNYGLELEAFVRDVNGGQDEYLEVSVYPPNTRRRILHIPKSAFTSTASLNKALYQVELHFWGNDTLVRQIVPALIEGYKGNFIPDKQRVTASGLHYLGDKWVWVFASEQKNSPVNWVFVPRTNEHPTISSNSAAVLDKQAIEQVLSLRSEDIMWPIIGWYGMAFLKNFLAAHNMKFPIFQITGGQGSGKSTYTDLISRMFGASRNQIVAKTTPFIVMKLMASTNAIPLNIKEFTLSSSYRLLEKFQNAYDISRDMRGTSWQGEIVYDLTAPIITDGEDAVNEASLRERVVVVRLSKQDLRDRDDRSLILDLMSKFEAGNIGELWRTYILTLLDTDSDRIISTIRDYERLIGNKFNTRSRVTHNHAIVLAGIHLFCEFAQLPIPSSVTDGSILINVLNNIVNLATGREFMAVDFVFRFAQDQIRLAQGSQHSAKFLYKQKDETTFLIEIRTLHKEYIDYVSKGGEGRKLSYRSIVQLVQESPYFREFVDIKGVPYAEIDFTELDKIGD